MELSPNHVIGRSHNQILGWTTHLFPVGQEDLEVHISFTALRIDPGTPLPSVCPRVCEGIAAPGLQLMSKDVQFLMDRDFIFPNLDTEKW